VLVTGTLVENRPIIATHIPIFDLNVTKLDNGKKNLHVSGLLARAFPANQTYEYGMSFSARCICRLPLKTRISISGDLAHEVFSAICLAARATLRRANEGNPIIRFIYAVKQKSLDNLYRIFPIRKIPAGRYLLGEANGLPDPFNSLQRY